MYKVLLLLLLLNFPILSQVFSIKGVVSDSSNNEPLSFANLRVMETQYGTTSNFDGEFNLRLDRGNYGLIFSYIGYKSDTIFVEIPSKKNLIVKLGPHFCGAEVGAGRRGRARVDGCGRPVQWFQQAD